MLVILLSNIVCRLFDSLHLIAGVFFPLWKKIGRYARDAPILLFFFFFQVKYCIWVVVNAEY